jgi:hypothetical protein
MTEFVQIKLNTFISMITTLIPVREFYHHTRPCVPILNNFHWNGRIVGMHGHHPIIISDFVNTWLSFENVCLHHVKHNLRGNPHNVSALFIMNSHTISHPKFVFIRVPLRPAIYPLQVLDQILDPLVNCIINECITIFHVPKGLFGNLSKSLPGKYCKIFQFNSFGIVSPSVDSKILKVYSDTSSSPGLISPTSK